jgi:hypothetical protein
MDEKSKTFPTRAKGERSVIAHGVWQEKWQKEWLCGTIGL